MITELSYPQGIQDISQNAAATNDAVSFVRFDIFERLGADKYQQEAGINLYMPENINNPLNSSWDGQSLGPGGVMAQGLIDSNRNRLVQTYRQTVGSMKSKLYGGSDANAADILANREQKILNPYMKMLFRGVNFRNFEFAFKFTPHSVDESRVIWQIIQNFRAAALPDGDENSFKWKYPREIEITYQYQGKPHPWLNRFKRCVITDCNVNYTSAGHYVSMRNGFPAETELRLQFTEIELLLRKDIELTNGPSY